MFICDEVIGLAPFEPDDAAVYRNWVNDEAFARLLGWAKPVSQEQHQSWYQQTISDENCVVFAVRELSEDRYLGNVWLHNIHWVNRNGELRILLGAENIEGRGYGTRACRLILQYAFERLGLAKAYLYVSALNPRAKRSFEKAGFTQEGLLVNEFFVDGKFHDVFRMAAFARGTDPKINGESPASEAELSG